MTPSPRTSESRPRELWQPDPKAQLAAAEILLAGPLPKELRSCLRERVEELERIVA